MSQQVINAGTTTGDGTGEALHTAFGKANSNFTELYARVNTGGTGTLAFYASSGTSLSPLTLGTNLSIAGTTLNASGGGSLPSLANGHVVANASGGTTTAGDTTVTALLDAALGSTRGNVLYRGAAGWSVLAPGTSGNVLSTGGVGADPSWAAPVVGTGSGTVNSASANLIAWYPATAAAVTGATLSALIDNNIGSTQGTILYRDAGGWLALPTGTSGQFLKTNGAGANPAWASATGAGTVNTGTTNTLAFYAANGTAVSPLTLGTNLSISGTTLNAAGGGSSSITFGTTITSAGAIPITEGFSVINNAAAAAYTLANDTVDGHLHTINNYGAGTSTITVSKLQGTTSVALILPSGGAANLVWHASLATYLYAS